MAQRILRPLDYGDLLDEVFDLYKRHFVLFAGMAALVYVPIMLVFYLLMSTFMTGMASPSTVSPEQALANVVPFLALILLIVPMTYIVMGATTWAVSHVYLGADTTIVQSYRAVARRAFSFFGALLLTWLVIGLGLVACIVPGVYLSLGYALVPAALMIEGVRGTQAMSRSWQLAQGHMLRIFVVLFLSQLLSGIVAQILQLPALFFGPTQTGFIAQGILAGVAQGLVTPIPVIALVLLYYDIRVRKEGFDLELLASSLGTTSKPESWDAETPSLAAWEAETIAPAPAMGLAAATDVPAAASLPETPAGEETTSPQPAAAAPAAAPTPAEVSPFDEEAQSGS